MTPVSYPFRDAAYYQKFHEEHDGYQQNNWLIEEIDRLTTFETGSILELACGNGRFLELASSRFDHVYACDWAVSPVLSRVLAEHGNVTFFRTDLYEGRPACEAELVVSADFLEHIAPDRLDEVLGRIDAMAPKAFHKIACYDDGHSHLSVFEPSYWLERLQRINPAYQLERVEDRFGDPNRKIAVFVKGRP